MATRLWCTQVMARSFINKQCDSQRTLSVYRMGEPFKQWENVSKSARERDRERERERERARKSEWWEEYGIYQDNDNKHTAILSERNRGLGRTVHINQERKWSKGPPFSRQTRIGPGVSYSESFGFDTSWLSFGIRVAWLSCAIRGLSIDSVVQVTKFLSQVETLALNP